jgi:hypothetical protein
MSKNLSRVVEHSAYRCCTLSNWLLILMSSFTFMMNVFLSPLKVCLIYLKVSLSSIDYSVSSRIVVVKIIFYGSLECKSLPISSNSVWWSIARLKSTLSTQTFIIFLFSLLKNPFYISYWMIAGVEINKREFFFAFFSLTSASFSSLESKCNTSSISGQN